MSDIKQIPDILPFDLTAIYRKSQAKVIGYHLTSTANIYVENRYTQPVAKLLNQEIDRIAEHLLKSDNPQLVIAIHGYANKKSDAEKRYENIYKYACDICESETVFVGYRWPAENPIQDDAEVGQPKPNKLINKIKFAFEALPTLLLGILMTNLVLGVTTITVWIGKSKNINILPTNYLFIASISLLLVVLLNNLGNASNFIPIFPNAIILAGLSILIAIAATNTSIDPTVSNILLLGLAILFALGCGVIFAFMALRLSTYPSDRYRASNYGVVDIVEFIRQLDKAIIEKACSQQNISYEKWLSINDDKIKKCRIKLSFINHSLGCEIATQTVRILSDVFDHDSVKQPINNLVEKNPPPDIGRVFSLARLILVAPDIPVESILSGRANPLRSSLRRCQEAYVFSNEADLALRLASTAANYFSFPATTRFRGYKLGNITARHYESCSKLRSFKYGIVNIYPYDDKPYKHLEVRASNLEHITLEELAYLKQTKEDKKAKENEQVVQRILEENAVADDFTYFDCTDYKDYKHSQGLLSFALKKPALNLWFDYIQLAYTYFLKPCEKIDVHGGYFDGKFSQLLIYELAFLGFQGMLNKSFQKSMHRLSRCCKNKGIQVVLGSKNYLNL